MSKTKIPEDIAALVRKVGKQFKSDRSGAIADCQFRDEHVNNSV